MIDNIPRYYNEDMSEIGVLVSHGWGAGWSTWASSEYVAIDGRIIEFWNPDGEHPSEDVMQKFIEEDLDYGYMYMGGYEDLDLEWVPVGERFVINEYDGAESIVPENSFPWITA